jgi:hypothetical protein
MVVSLAHGYNGSKARKMRSLAFLLLRIKRSALRIGLQLNVSAIIKNAKMLFFIAISWIIWVDEIYNNWHY